MHPSQHAPLFRTRITALFGIRHPLLLGGMHILGESGLMAAVVNAGAMGFITARSFASPDALRADLRRCHALTGGRPFGVNITLARRDDANSAVQDWIRVALQEGVRHFESAGGPPGELVGPIQRGGGILIHKCPSVRHALSAERCGVDAVARVGMEEGGHPGANPLPTFVNGAHALQSVSVPLVLGGGIGTGRQIAAARTPRCVVHPLSKALTNRATPELEYLQAKWASHLPYRQATALLKEVLPLDKGISSAALAIEFEPLESSSTLTSKMTSRSCPSL